MSTALQHFQPFIDVTFDELLHEARVRFLPWIGDGYRQAQHRVMFLGESHYGTTAQNENPLFTRAVIAEHLDGDRKRFFTGLYGVLQAANPAITEVELWRNIAFHNLAQEMVGLKPRLPPTEEMWADGRMLLKEVAVLLEPRIVVVMSFRLWDKLALQNPQELVTQLANRVLAGTAPWIQASPLFLRFKHPAGRGYRKDVWQDIFRTFHRRGGA